MTDTTNASQNPDIAPKVVHEAIDERQHVRTRIPARATLSGDDFASVDCDVLDVSLGGIGLKYAQPLKMGALLNASIHMSLNSLELSVDAQVKVVSQNGGEVGLQFVDLDLQKRDILRYIISSYMSGEIADINGLFNVMQRENYIKARKQKHAVSRTAGDRLSASLGTLLFAAAGLFAAFVVLSRLYILFMHVPAASALVSADVYNLSMPENGNLEYLLPADKTSLQTGDPLASISSQLATRFTTPADMDALAKLSPDDAQILLSRATVETVIHSPCDCDLYALAPRLNGFFYKESPLFELVPRNEPLFVKAHVPYAKLNDINRISSVTLTLYGSSETMDGEIVAATVNEKTEQVELRIRPEKPLPRDAYRKPVAVDLYRGFF